MSLPRQVIPGANYMISRRCSERRFFLRPDRDTNNAFIYCLALAAQRARVEVLFVVAMSNHYHAGLHDPEGNFPIFSEHFHALLARCQNTHLGRFESFWSSDPTSVVRLLQPEDTLEKMVYAYANPTAADLVDTGEEWPGVNSFIAATSTGRLEATRPTYFFRSQGEQPERVILPIVRPCEFAGSSASEWCNLLIDRVRAAEAEHRARRFASGKSVLGREAVLAQNPFAAPGNPEPRFGINPRVAAKSKWARIEALQRSRDFLARYKPALRAWLAGVVDVIFPFGTYWMRRFAHVACEAVDNLQGDLASASWEARAG
jgi:putative transposase